MISGFIKLVLSSSLTKNTPMDNYLGFASPRVVRHPYTREPWLLFTAWRDQSGVEREIWAAPVIDEFSLEIDLRRSKKISAGSSVGVKGLNTVDVFYDYYDDRWIIFSTIYGGDPKSLAVIYSDPDFTKIEASLIESPINMGDAGFSCISYEDDKILTCTGGFGLERSLMTIDDFAKKQLSKPVLVKKSIGGLLLGEAADVHKTFVYGGRILMLTENLGGTGTWHIQLYMGPRIGWKKWGDQYSLGKWYMPLSTKIPLPFASDYEKTSYGHPEYTLELRKPWLMWASFRHCHWPQPDKGLKWAHEIWAAETSVDYFSNPREWLPAVFEADETIEPPWILDTLGASKILIHVYRPRETHELVVRHGRDVGKLSVGDGRYVEERYVVSKEQRIVIDPAPPAIYIEPTDPRRSTGVMIYLLP
ncbi:MAG: hypothetical protein ACP5GI_01910 [Sulfolobales archaeon]